MKKEKLIQFLGNNSRLSVGEKAFKLSKIPKSKYYKIPKSFIITTQALDYFLYSNNIDSNLKYEKIKKLIKSSQLPRDLEKMIFNAFNTLSSKFVVVRSSSRIEDRTKSFAGVFTTTVGVKKNDLINAIKETWISSFCIKEKAKTGVLVQELINATSSGIMFTKTNIGNTAIESVFGLGEMLVSGNTTPDYYSLLPNGKIFNMEINIQKKYLTLLKKGFVGLKKVEAHRLYNMKLTLNQLVKLANSVKTIQKLTSGSRDIEFSFVEDQLYILQDRPGKKIIEKQVKIEEYLKRENTMMIIPTLVETMNKYIYKLVNIQSYRSIYMHKKNHSFIYYFDFLYEWNLIFWKTRVLLKNNKKSKQLLEKMKVDFVRIKKFLKHMQNKETFQKNDFEKLFKNLKNIYIYFFLLRVLVEVYEKEKSPIKKEAIKLRKFSETFLYEAINVLHKYIGNKHKKYLKYFNVIDKESFFELVEKNFLSMKKSKLLDNLLKGCFYFNKKIYPISKLDMVRKKNYIELVATKKEKETSKIIGKVVFPGKVKGRVRVIKNKKDYLKFKKKEILVVHMTSINMIEIMEKCSAIITDEGSILCHAAINARELKKPCMVGCKNSTKILKTGDMVLLDTKTQTLIKCH